MLKFVAVSCFLLISVDGQCFNFFATYTTSTTLTQTCCSSCSPSSSGTSLGTSGKRRRTIVLDDELDVKPIDMKKLYDNNILKVIKADNVQSTERDVELESSIYVQKKPGLRQGRFKFYWWTTTSTSTSTTTTFCNNAQSCSAYSACS